MSLVTRNQPESTPTWTDLDVTEGAEAERAAEFYGAVFGWEFRADAGHGITCLLRGRPVAGLRTVSEGADRLGAWRMYFAADDCDAVAGRAVAAGATVTRGPDDIGTLGRTAVLLDPVGAEFGLWQGRDLLGCELVNEPGTLVRNDLSTPEAERARTFYAAVFSYTLDGNKDLPDFDFTFLRRPDGHEIGGVFGVPGAPSSRWETTFEVADTDAVAARATEAGGAAEAPSDTPYGRMARLTDPLGSAFHVIARPR
ncbi:VOC family protein [Streptomyces kanamyceticus]|uniref:VOC family protein n=1 Tax=Streptomyces kanamyceticus TaxID=1967 RepID=A0A5J6GB65_STRKN|nr:VOC family protein [Streptomyces kanamyceticus]QEU92247.1 VOC family protein [Streptomyces kanamyceticus]